MPKYSMTNVRRPQLTLCPREGHLSGEMPGLPHLPYSSLFSAGLPHPSQSTNSHPTNRACSLRRLLPSAPATGPKVTSRRKAWKVLLCPSCLHFFLFNITLVHFQSLLKSSLWGGVQERVRVTSYPKYPNS